MVEDLTHATDEAGSLRPVSTGDPTEEQIETVWRQLMVYKLFADNDLAESRARRVEAESARDQAEADVFRTRKAEYERMKADADRVRREAHEIGAEAVKAKEAAEVELTRVDELKAQAKKERAEITARAQERAKEIIEQARATARQEASELRRQALSDIREMLSRIENVKAAVGEEAGEEAGPNGEASAVGAITEAPGGKKASRGKKTSDDKKNSVTPQSQ